MYYYVQSPLCRKFSFQQGSQGFSESIMSKFNSQIAILFITFCVGVLGTVRGGCPVSGGDGRRGEGGSSPVQGRDARIGKQKHYFKKYFCFNHCVLQVRRHRSDLNSLQTKFTKARVERAGAGAGLRNSGAASSSHAPVQDQYRQQVGKWRFKISPFASSFWRMF